MSYCRKEGKDIIVFATEDDLAEPSKVKLLPDDPKDVDTSHQSAILPDGTINWDCPCLGNLPNGPCGPAFRDAFSCWVENKSDQDAFASKCFDSFSAWEGCLSENRDIYKSENDDISKSKSEPKDMQHEVDVEESSLEIEATDLSNSVNATVPEAKPAIAAAYTEGET